VESSHTAIYFVVDDCKAVKLIYKVITRLLLNYKFSSHFTFQFPIILGNVYGREAYINDVIMYRHLTSNILVITCIILWKLLDACRKTKGQNFIHSPISELVESFLGLKSR